MHSSLSERRKDEQLKVVRITNNDLICKDCRYCLDDSKQFGNTSRCEKFSLKPNEVWDKHTCRKYKKKLN